MFCNESWLANVIITFCRHPSSEVADVKRKRRPPDEDVISDTSSNPDSTFNLKARYDNLLRRMIFKDNMSMDIKF